MLNVLHAIWNNEALEAHPLQESLSLFYHRMPTWDTGLEQISGYSIDHLLQRASHHPTVDWLVVHGEGSLYQSQNKIVTASEDLIRSLDEDVFVAGHLVNEPGSYCGLHEQFMIVNIKAYRKMESPYFGDYGDREVLLQNFQAHPSQSRTPTSLEGGEGQSTYKTWARGWHFLHMGFQCGYRAVNLPKEITSEKIYIYPRSQPEQFLQNMEALYKIIPTKNINQNRTLIYILMKKLGLGHNSILNAMAEYPKRKEGVFVFNTEPLIPDPQWIKACGGELAGFIGTCAGFLDLANLKHFGFNEKTKLVYYDLNPDSVTFKEHLLNSFEGDLETLPRFIEDFKARYPQIIIADNNAQAGLDNLRKEFGSPDEFKNLWNRMRRLDRTFTASNLFYEYKSIVAHGPGPDQRTLMCISDIFTGMNELTYGIHVLRGIFRNIVADLKDHKQLILQGTDYKNGPILDYLPNLYRKYNEGIPSSTVGKNF